MIRFLCSFIVVFGISLGVSAQILLTEEFTAGQMPPAGWSIDRYASNWTTTYAAAAVGYSLPECSFSKYSEPVIDTTRLISPVLDLTGFDSVKLHFWYGFIRNGAGTPYIGVATRSAGGPWDSVWAFRPTSGLSHTEFSKWIKNSDVGSGQFQFCLFVQGNLNCLTYWHIDDIILSSPSPTDGYLLSLGNTPAFTTGPFAIEGNLVNSGLNTIQSVVINWQLDGGSVHSTQLTGLDLAPYERHSFTCSDSALAQPGKNQLSVWLDQVNGAPDDDPGNDTLHLMVQHVANPVQRIPLIEDFNSSTCIYCPGYEYELVPWCDQLGDSVAVVKYQMDFPGNGDPYYTSECGVRGEYYDVSAVPNIYCDGGKVANGTLDFLKTAFYREVARKGLMTIRTYHELHGDSITVQTTVTPLADFPHLRLQQAVVEKKTFNNVSTSGQTEFTDVLMKMIPHPGGTPVSLTANQPYVIMQSASLAGTNIEEMTDLKVVVWVEDTVTKTVLQSSVTMGGPIPSSEARLIRLLVDSIDVAGFSPDLFSYTVAISDTGNRIPGVIGIPMDSNATVVVTPPAMIPGTAVLDVTAQDQIAHTQYTVSFILTGMADPPENRLTVYPNPASGALYILGAEHARITLWSVAGTCRMAVPDFTGSTLPLQSVPAGVYVLKIERRNGQTVHTRIVVR